MKVLKLLGGFLFSLGCIAAFVGLAATILPMIQNDQLKLVLSSFSAPSQNGFVNVVNLAMTYALNNCYLVMLLGAGASLVGALLMLPNRDAQKQPTESRSNATLSPYMMKPNEERDDEIPVWRSNRAAFAREINPFADTSLADMLSPKAVPPRKEPPNMNFSSAAPATPQTMPQSLIPSSPYARPSDKYPPETAPLMEESAPPASIPSSVKAAAAPIPEAATSQPYLGFAQSNLALPAKPDTSAAPLPEQDARHSPILIRSSFPSFPSLQTRDTSAALECPSESAANPPITFNTPASPSRIKSTMGKRG